MIEFQQAGFNYGASAVLRDLNLTLSPGAFHVLVGTSGAGKSTFLRLCYRDLRATSGEIRWFGQSVASNRDAIASLRRMIGVVPQDPSFLDHLDLRDNIALPLSVSGIPPEDRASDLQALLEWVDLSGRGAALPRELTAGERQRAALARAVILSPEVILADEPTGGVDWDAALRLLMLLIELNRMGKTVLITTHDPQVLRALDGEVEARVLHLAEGRIEAVEMAQ